MQWVTLHTELSLQVTNLRLLIEWLYVCIIICIWEEICNKNCLAPYKKNLSHMLSPLNSNHEVIIWIFWKRNMGKSKCGSYVKNSVAVTTMIWSVLLTHALQHRQINKIVCLKGTHRVLCWAPTVTYEIPDLFRERLLCTYFSSFLRTSLSMHKLLTHCKDIK